MVLIMKAIFHCFVYNQLFSHTLYVEGVVRSVLRGYIKRVARDFDVVLLIGEVDLCSLLALLVCQHYFPRLQYFSAAFSSCFY